MDTTLTAAQQRERQLDAWDFELNALVVRYWGIYSEVDTPARLRQKLLDKAAHIINITMDAVEEVEGHKRAAKTMTEVLG